MSDIHYSTDAGTISTDTVAPAAIVCFQTLPNCRGHFIARINAMTDTGYVKAWQYSVRFKRIDDTTPVLSTPIEMLVDGDAEASAWTITFQVSANGLICMMCSGSDVHTTWIARFDAVETCSEA